MATVDVIVALPWERRAMLRPLPRVSRIATAGSRLWAAEVEGGRLRLLQTGMGQDAARSALAALPGSGPWIVVGCAGGLAPHLVAGDVIVADAVVAGADHWRCDPAWSGQVAAALVASGLRPQRGLVASAGAALLTAADKRRAHVESGALVVEMEGAAIAAAAAARDVPVAMVRVVLDDAATTIATGAGDAGVALAALPLDEVAARLADVARALADLPARKWGDSPLAPLGAGNGETPH